MADIEHNPDHGSEQVMTLNGIVAGSTDPHSGVRSFKGIPFAMPPVGDLRWKPPQPVESWTGVRDATRFGPRGMQLPLFGDMGFRSDGMSEDCLYLNVWTPAEVGEELLPVLIYFYGGGNLAGDGSEPRYDGTSLARKGLVVLTVNYRLNVFGFFSHPELSEESPHGASGNYGYLDQAAGIQWAHDNIRAFGGDPERITIAGESAGSSSVSAQMISPLSKHLIAGAIGSSGSLLRTLPANPLERAERNGMEFAESAGAKTLAELRAMPADELLAATAKVAMGRFTGAIDGYFLTDNPSRLFGEGKQAHVPLLVGWNSEEMSYPWLLQGKPLTAENFEAVVRTFFGKRAEEALKLYPAEPLEALEQSATDLAGDLFIGYSTWKWAELHAKTGEQPVYRYLYAHPRPEMVAEMGDAVAGLAGGVISGKDAEETPRPPAAKGAVHSADIEYFMGSLATNLVYEWTSDDFALSELMQSYYANFVKTGDPNGEGLPEWPAIGNGDTVSVMLLDVDAHVEAERYRERYLFIDNE